MANLKTMMNIRSSQSVFQGTTKVSKLNCKRKNISGLVGIQNEIYLGKAG